MFDDQKADSVAAERAAQEAIPTPTTQPMAKQRSAGSGGGGGGGGGAVSFTDEDIAIALTVYEHHFNLPAGSATINQVEATSAGVQGWLDSTHGRQIRDDNNGGGGIRNAGYNTGGGAAAACSGGGGGSSSGGAPQNLKVSNPRLRKTGATFCEVEWIDSKGHIGAGLKSKQPKIARNWCHIL